MTSKTLRLIALLLFMPAALLPTEVDLCLKCLFGDDPCLASCCQPEDSPDEDLPSCCSTKVTPEALEKAEAESCASANCCIHIDNERDELPAPVFALDLPEAHEIGLVEIVPASGLVFALELPALVPDRSPPPETPLPLLI